MDTVNAAVEAAQEQGTFDVLAFVEQTAYPTKTVVVFQDPKSGAEYTIAVNKRIELDKATKPTKDQAAEKENLSETITELGDKIAKSAIVFELRGMPPGVIQSILKAPKLAEDEVDEGEQEREDTLVAKSIISVANSAGVPDTRIWDAAAIDKLRIYLKEGEFGKLLEGVTEVNFNTAMFDAATDAGFSGRSSDVA